MCGAKGHKLGECPDRDKCCLCKQPGHKARECKNPWGNNPPDARPLGAGSAALAPAGAHPPGDPAPSGSQQEPEVNIFVDDNPLSTSGQDQADNAHDVSTEGIPVETTHDPVPTDTSPDVSLSQSQESRSWVSIGEFSSPEPPLCCHI